MRLSSHTTLPDRVLAVGFPKTYDLQTAAFPRAPLLHHRFTLGMAPAVHAHAYAMIVLNSLDWHRGNKRLRLYSYVVMPTHFHALAQPVEGRTISDNLQSLGSFTAHSILQQLRTDNLIVELEFFAANREPDRTEQHQIWQPMQAKNIYTPAFLLEKLEYVHNNPVAKKWQLAEHRDEYVYSSARFYNRGVEPIIAVDDVRLWLTV